jgi:excisionase family DNA binding protein
MWCDVSPSGADQTRRASNSIHRRVSGARRVNLKTAARQLGVHYQTAYRWVRSGQLVAVKVGAGYEISDAALSRFQAQRAAMERIPEVAERIEPDPTDPASEVLLQLEEMVACTTVDATAVYQRAAQALASVIGDAVTVSLREADGSLRLAAFDHSDPERAVAMGAMLRFGNPDEPLYSRRAAETGEAVFVPQVPQREVRTQVRPEFHQALRTAGFYSAVSAPIVGTGVVRGSVLASRDTPGRPYTIEDRDFVVAVAFRIGAAVAQAERGHAAWSLRARLANDLAEWVDHGDFDRAREWLMDEVPDGEPVAVVNLDMSVDGATTAFADQFGSTASDLKEQSMRDLVDVPDAVQDTFDRLREGEFDYCTNVVRPVGRGRAPVVLHGAIVRLEDATPCCVLYVAHAVPEVASA